MVDYVSTAGPSYSADPGLNLYDLRVSSGNNVDNAIKQMGKSPNVEFMFGVRRATVMSPSDNVAVNNANSLMFVNPEANGYFYPNEYQFTRPKYDFQTSHDTRSVSIRTGVDMKRSHSIHTFGSRNAHNPLNQILSNRYISNISGPMRPCSTVMRRSTVHRISETEDLYVPRESWLTSIYTKLPKSKTFCRFQLELLNLPLFASVGRFLEESATTNDCKAMLDRNSFLYALFKQFVPNNRIPVNKLSKYLHRLHKYEILATIEFNVSLPKTNYK